MSSKYPSCHRPDQRKDAMLDCPGDNSDDYWLYWFDFSSIDVIET